MSKSLRGGRDRAPSTPEFVPGPRRLRVDGWTPDRQRRFIETLADTGCISHACEAVGMSRQSAYRLRRSAANSMFSHAWDFAIRLGIERLRDLALERATEGVVHPVFFRGEQIGERRVYSDRLLTYLMDRAPMLNDTDLSTDQLRQLWPAMLATIDAVGDQPFDDHNPMPGTRTEEDEDEKKETVDEICARIMAEYPVQSPATCATPAPPAATLPDMASPLSPSEPEATQDRPSGPGITSFWG